MAMNKKEQAEFAAAKKAVFVARVLNWTAPVETDVPAPASGRSGETTGFLFNEHGKPCVMYAISSSVGHGTSWDEAPKKTSSQGARAMYSTRVLALKAMRHALENKYAEILAAIDMQIQEES